MTILITCRRTPDAERTDNLLAVLGARGGDAPPPVIVLEQDTVPRLGLPADLPGVARAFAYNPGPLNKSWGLNVAARHAQTPWLVFAQPDVLAPGALERVRVQLGSGALFIKPYRRVVALDAADSDALRRGRAQAADFTGQAAEVPPLCAGLFAIRTDVFWQLGGWDERFAAPAAADAAFGHKVERARLPALQFDDAPALRLWQAEDDAAADADTAGRLAALRALGAPEWERLLEVQTQLAGHREKYRPLA